MAIHPLPTKGDSVVFETNNYFLNVSKGLKQVRKNNSWVVLPDSQYTWVLLGQDRYNGNRHKWNVIPRDEKIKYKVDIPYQSNQHSFTYEATTLNQAMLLALGELSRLYNQHIPLIRSKLDMSKVKITKLPSP